MDETIEGLNWAAARISAHPDVAFKRLEQTVQQYVDTLNDSGIRTSKAVMKSEGGFFTVTMRNDRVDLAWVGFRLRGPHIEIVRHGNVDAVGEPMLTATGHLRFEVNREQITEWQFLEKALDPLFFPRG